MSNLNMLKKSFYSHLKESYNLNSIYSLLSWDQQVNLPPAASENRALHLELMERLLHQRASDEIFYKIVCELQQESSKLPIEDQVNIRETKRSVDRQRKLPESFVSEKALVTSHAFNAWLKARPENDFASVKPHLEKTIELLRKESDLVGYKEHPYDALLDVYEPYAKLSDVKPLLIKLGEDLKGMVGQIIEKTPQRSKKTFIVAESEQAKLCLKVCQDFGYSLESGRIDRSAHPFQSTISGGDVRITVRYYEDNFLSALFSAMHEAGHALYELGFENKHLGTPMASAISLGIHESQSRLWENFIGRSKEFSAYLHTLLKECTPELHKQISVEELWSMCNEVKPSLIRVESDEVTYSLHVVIRMLLEEDLIAGKLQVSELPEAWNALYQKYLGIHSTEMKNGVLQDVHWYSGSIGYFPTYALGNLYAAMFLEKAKSDIPGLMSGVSSGNFKPLLNWLRNNIHKHGMHYHSQELIKNVSGKPLDSEAFLRYIKEKFTL